VVSAPPTPFTAISVGDAPRKAIVCAIPLPPPPLICERRIIETFTDVGVAFARIGATMDVSRQPEIWKESTTEDVLSMLNENEYAPVADVTMDWVPAVRLCAEIVTPPSGVCVV
jgi:hypothetical protein